MSMLVSPGRVKENLLSDFLRPFIQGFSTLGMEVKYKPKTAIYNCWNNEEINELEH